MSCFDEDFFSENIITFRCAQCKKEDVDRILKSHYDKKTSGLVKSMLSMLDLNKPLCGSCASDFIQLKKMDCGHQILMEQLASNVNGLKLEWSSEVYSIPNVQQYLKDIIGTSASKIYGTTLSGNVKSRFKQFYKKKLKYRIIDLRQKVVSGQNRKKVVKQLNGSRFKSVSDYSEYLSHSLEKPKDGVIGVVLLPSNNYFMMMPIPMLSDVVVSLAMKESQLMLKQPHNKRFGGASGIVTSWTNSSSLPTVCKDNDKSTTDQIEQEYYLSCAQQGVGASIVYRNSEKKLVQFNSIYNDVKMSTLSPGKHMFNRIRHCSAFRDYCVMEEITRLHTMLILEQFNLLDKNSTESYVQVVRHNVMLSKTIGDKCEEWANHYTKLELGLLNACQFFDTDNNHSALSAHVDGNRGSNIETLSLIGRLPISTSESFIEDKAEKKIKSKSMYHKILKDMKGGFLFLPMDGIIIKISIGDMLLNCNFDNTIHLPDLERGIYNFSRTRCGKRKTNPDGERLQQIRKKV